MVSVDVRAPAERVDPFSGVTEPGGYGDPVPYDVTVWPAGEDMDVSASRPHQRSRRLGVRFPYGTSVDEAAQVEILAGPYAGVYAVCDSGDADAGHWLGLSGWEAGTVVFLRRTEG